MAWNAQAPIPRAASVPASRSRLRGWRQLKIADYMHHRLGGSGVCQNFASEPFNPNPKQEHAAFNRLADDCQPASFGKDGEAVLDPTYRKATTMNSSQFDTSLCPYRLGIISRVRQVLLPHVTAPGAGNAESGSVVAELYKLNIYAGPSGFFKAHVDTPRSETQFGSLVVCLPCSHAGGQLIVKHAGQEMEYDWSTPQDALEPIPAFLQWAAFYSDCEHEVHETQGEALDLGHSLAPIHIERLPLYARVQQALADPRFMTDGGLLGIYCSHAYAYSTSRRLDLDHHDWQLKGKDLKESEKARKESFRRHLPTTLKGTDLALFAVFKHMGLKVTIRPIISDIDQIYEPEKEEDRKPCIGEIPGMITVTRLGGSDGDDARDIPNAFGERLSRVNWITAPRWENLATVHLTYGNEPGVHAVYAYSALMVDILPAAKRLEANANMN